MNAKSRGSIGPLKRRLLLTLACLGLLAACAQAQARRPAPLTAIPQSRSERIGQFIWQEDGSYAYAMLRPAGWKTAEDSSRTYLAPGATGPAAIAIIAQNLQVFEKNGMAQAYIEPLALYRQNPNLQGWTRALEHAWQQTGALANIEPIRSLERAEVYAIHAAGGYLRLMAFIVDQDQPLLLTLDTQGELADLNRLQEEGILEDFFTMAASMRAIPYQPGIENPALEE